MTRPTNYIRAFSIYATLLCGQVLIAQITDEAEQCAGGVCPGTTIVTFDAPGAMSTYPQSINQAAAVAGDYLDGNNVLHGFVRDSSGTITPFAVPGGEAGAYQSTSGAGINKAGMVTGSYVDSNGSNYGFVRAADGTIVTFSGPGTSPIYPTSINDSGFIAGSYTDALTSANHGFVRAPDGTIAVFDPSEETIATYATSINADGAITGNYNESNDVYYGFVRAPDGTITTFGAPDGMSIFPGSINTAGTITGFYDNADGGFGGFERTSNGSMALINDQHAGVGEGQGTIPPGINNFGKIAGISSMAMVCPTDLRVQRLE